MKTLTMGDYTINLDEAGQPVSIEYQGKVYQINQQTVRFDTLPMGNEDLYMLQCATVEGYTFDGEASSYKSCGLLDTEQARPLH